MRILNMACLLAAGGVGTLQGGELHAGTKRMSSLAARDSLLAASTLWRPRSRRRRVTTRAGSIPQIRELWTMIPKEPIPKKEPVHESIPLKESILNEESILCGESILEKESILNKESILLGELALYWFLGIGNWLSDGNQFFDGNRFF